MVPGQDGANGTPLKTISPNFGRAKAANRTELDEDRALRAVGPVAMTASSA